MIKWFVELLCQVLFGIVQRRCVDHVRQKIEQKALRAYLRTLLAARGLVIGGLTLLFFTQLMIFGFMLFVAAMLIWFPFSIEVKIMVMLGLSAVLFFIPLFIVLFILSERFWFRFSGAERFFQELTPEADE